MRQHVFFSVAQELGKYLNWNVLSLRIVDSKVDTQKEISSISMPKTRFAFFRQHIPLLDIHWLISVSSGFFSGTKCDCPVHVLMKEYHFCPPSPCRNKLQQIEPGRTIAVTFCITQLHSNITLLYSYTMTHCISRGLNRNPSVGCKIDTIDEALNSHLSKNHIYIETGSWPVILSNQYNGC